MLAMMLLQLPLALLPAPDRPPDCQLEVLPPFVLEERVLEDFTHRVAHYVRLHRRLERELPPEHLFVESDDMPLAVDALHAAMVAARPNARAGTYFTAPVAYLLTHRLHRAITANGYTPAEVLAAINANRVPGMRRPAVNDRLPGVSNIEVWPALRAVLPPLPKELTFRFVDRDLVLWDIHADLIVDVLEDALPAR
jgi:hypothetical protein